ncbi:MAG TPA: hypothetical protein ENF20_03960 [Candidatus Marinimicrobia bacterium]|nr:hypothetical protein [Candidatus Neomarinimicrobiota bacterium]
MYSSISPSSPGHATSFSGLNLTMGPTLNFSSDGASVVGTDVVVGVIVAVGDGVGEGVGDELGLGVTSGVGVGVVGAVTVKEALAPFTVTS